MVRPVSLAFVKKVKKIGEEQGYIFNRLTQFMKQDVSIGFFHSRK